MYRKKKVPATGKTGSPPPKLVSPPASTKTTEGVPGLAEPPLQIGSFNLAKWMTDSAGTRRPDVCHVLVDILKRYDMLVLMELKLDSETNIERLIQQLSAVDPVSPYDYEMSESPCNSQGESEQYCIFYRSRKLSVLHVHGSGGGDSHSPRHRGARVPLAGHTQSTAVSSQTMAGPQAENSPPEPSSQTMAGPLAENSPPEPSSQTKAEPQTYNSPPAPYSQTNTGLPSSSSHANTSSQTENSPPPPSSQTNTGSQTENSPPPPSSQTNTGSQTENSPPPPSSQTNTGSQTENSPPAPSSQTNTGSQTENSPQPPSSQTNTGSQTENSPQPPSSQTNTGSQTENSPPVPSSQTNTGSQTENSPQPPSSQTNTGSQTENSPQPPSSQTNTGSQTENSPPVPSSQTNTGSQTENLPPAPSNQTNTGSQTENLPPAPSNQTNTGFQTENLPPAPSNQTNTGSQTENLPPAPSNQINTGSQTENWQQSAQSSECTCARLSTAGFKPPPARVENVRDERQTEAEHSPPAFNEDKTGADREPNCLCKDQTKVVHNETNIVDSGIGLKKSQSQLNLIHAAIQQNTKKTFEIKEEPEKIDSTGSDDKEGSGPYLRDEATTSIPCDSSTMSVWHIKPVLTDDSKGKDKFVLFDNSESLDSSDDVEDEDSPFSAIGLRKAVSRLDILAMASHEHEDGLETIETSGSCDHEKETCPLFSAKAFLEATTPTSINVLEGSLDSNGDVEGEPVLASSNFEHDKDTSLVFSVKAFLMATTSISHYYPKLAVRHSKDRLADVKGEEGIPKRASRQSKNLGDKDENAPVCSIGSRKSVSWFDLLVTSGHQHGEKSETIESSGNSENMLSWSEFLDSRGDVENEPVLAIGLYRSVSCLTLRARRPSNDVSDEDEDALVAALGLRNSVSRLDLPGILRHQHEEELETVESSGSCEHGKVNYLEAMRQRYNTWLPSPSSPDTSMDVQENEPFLTRNVSKKVSPCVIIQKRCSHQSNNLADEDDNTVIGPRKSTSRWDLPEIATHQREDVKRDDVTLDNVTQDDNVTHNGDVRRDDVTLDDVTHDDNVTHSGNVLQDGVTRVQFPDVGPRRVESHFDLRNHVVTTAMWENLLGLSSAVPPPQRVAQQEDDVPRMIHTSVSLDHCFGSHGSVRFGEPEESIHAPGFGRKSSEPPLSQQGHGVVRDERVNLEFPPPLAGCQRWDHDDWKQLVGNACLRFTGSHQTHEIGNCAPVDSSHDDAKDFQSLSKLIPVQASKDDYGYHDQKPTTTKASVDDNGKGYQDLQPTVTVPGVCATDKDYHNHVPTPISSPIESKAGTDKDYHNHVPTPISAPIENKAGLLNGELPHRETAMSGTMPSKNQRNFGDLETQATGAQQEAVVRLRKCHSNINLLHDGTQDKKTWAGWKSKRQLHTVAKTDDEQNRVREETMGSVQCLNRINPVIATEAHIPEKKENVSPEEEEHGDKNEVQEIKHGTRETPRPTSSLFPEDSQAQGGSGADDEGVGRDPLTYVCVDCDPAPGNSSVEGHLGTGNLSFGDDQGTGNMRFDDQGVDRDQLPDLCVDCDPATDNSSVKGHLGTGNLSVGDDLGAGNVRFDGYESRPDGEGVDRDPLTNACVDYDLATGNSSVEGHLATDNVSVGDDQGTENMRFDDQGVDRDPLPDVCVDCDPATGNSSVKCHLETDNLSVGDDLGAGNVRFDGYESRPDDQGVSRDPATGNSSVEGHLATDNVSVGDDLGTGDVSGNADNNVTDNRDKHGNKPRSRQPLFCCISGNSTDEDDDDDDDDDDDGDDDDKNNRKVHIHKDSQRLASKGDAAASHEIVVTSARQCERQVHNFNTMRYNCIDNRSCSGDNINCSADDVTATPASSDSSVSDAESLKGVFCRQPFAVHFISPLTDLTEFAVIVIHTDPSDARQEMRAIQHICDVTSTRWYLQNLLVTGQFVMDESERGAQHWRGVGVKSDRRFTNLCHPTGGPYSSLSSLDRNYDRFIVVGRELNTAVRWESVGCYRYDQVLNLTPAQVSEVSDHYPIELQLAGITLTRWQKHVRARGGVAVDQKHAVSSSVDLKRLCRAARGQKSSAFFTATVLYDSPEGSQREVRARRNNVTDVVQCLRDFQTAFPDLLRDTTVDVASSFVTSRWIASSPAYGLCFGRDATYEVTVTVTLRAPHTCQVQILREVRT